MATSGKGGFRNNGQPRVTLKRGRTRVAQLKAAIREIQSIIGEVRRVRKGKPDVRICAAALDGTYTE